MLMPAFERNGVTGIRLAAQAGERSPGVGERIHANPEPRDAETAPNSDEAEQQDDHDLDRFEMLQDAKVEDDDDADEEFQDKQKRPCVIRYVLQVS